MIRNKLSLIVTVLPLVFLSACATTESVKQTDNSIDPWEGWNRKVQTFNDNLDEYAMKPVAKGYRFVMPVFADEGVSNFFSNIDDIGVALNNLLQGKFSQSGSDAARFLLNSTIGLAGFFDVASEVDLQKHDEDFGQTLGVWGVPTGPYLVLPFFGPSSPRGVGGLAGDAAMNPISYVGSYVSIGLFALNAIDKRADNLGTERIATEAAIDRYTFFRDAYLSRRNYLVHDGNVPDDDFLNEDFDEDSMSPVKPY